MTVGSDWAGGQPGVLAQEHPKALPTVSSSEPLSDRPLDRPLVGTVLAVQANFYRVRLEPSLSAWILPEGSLPERELLCTRRSRLKKVGQQVMVGDRVRIEEPDWQGKRGAIHEVLPRSSELDRPPVANADQVLLIFALADPPLEPHQLSRFLLKAESTGLEIVLGLSKCDLVSQAEQQGWQQRLQAWGYVPCFLSVYQGLGLEGVRRQLCDRMTIVVGPSGVGKSSLINALIPELQLRVGEVSGKLARGRHTTRHVELFELPDGGLLADTPGFNQPDLGCGPEELPHYFPEIRSRLAQATCQFANCCHGSEPGCVVRGDWERHAYYLTLLEEARQYQEQQLQSAGPELGLKRKTSRQGEVYEPKLASKQFRRESRRSRRQGVENFSGSLEELLQQGED